MEDHSWINQPPRWDRNHIQIKRMMIFDSPVRSCGRYAVIETSFNYDLYEEVVRQKRLQRLKETP